MIIRPVRKGETKTLQDLNDEVFADNSKYDSDLKKDWAQSKAGKKYFTEVINNPEAICLIAKDKNKPIGYIAAAPKEFDWRLCKYLEIENMGVSPSYRSKGIGSKLIKECLKIAKKRGFQRVFLTSYYENSQAVAFYETSGFKKIDVSLERDI